MRHSVSGCIVSALAKQEKWIVVRREKIRSKRWIDDRAANILQRSYRFKFRYDTRETRSLLILLVTRRFGQVSVKGRRERAKSTMSVDVTMRKRGIGKTARIRSALDSLLWIIRIIFSCLAEKSMRLPRRCIIHGIVSDRWKINRPDQTLSNRTLTAYFLPFSLAPCIRFLLLLPLSFISFGSCLASCDKIDG